MALIGSFNPVSSTRGQYKVNLTIIFYYNSTKVMVKSTVDCPQVEETGLNCPRSAMGTLYLS